METNPYLQHQSESNPYLKAAMDDAATAQVIRNLTQLFSEDSSTESKLGTALPPEMLSSQQTKSEAQNQNPYKSALDGTASKPSSLPTSSVSPDYPSSQSAIPSVSSGYISITDTESDELTPSSVTVSKGNQSEVQHPAESPSSNAGDRPIPHFSQPQPYQSPEEILRAERARKRQEQERSRQEALKQQQQAQAQAQQAAAKRRQLEIRAQQFLAKLERMDRFEGDRMWFEAFAELCPSRLEAAIEFIQTMDSA